MLDQRLEGTAAVVIIDSHGPDVRGRDGCYAVKLVVNRPRVRAGDGLPGGAIPALDQRLEGTAAVSIVSHGPDVASRDGCHTIKVVATRPGAGTGDDLPGGAVPVLDQRLEGTKIVSHGPDVGG